MIRPKSPTADFSADRAEWDAAPPGWIRITDLPGVVERCLGVPSAEVLQHLRPAIEVRRIDHRLLERPGIEENDPFSFNLTPGTLFRRVQPSEWAEVGRSGLSQGAPVEVLWDDVREEVARLRAAGSLPTLGSERPALSHGKLRDAVTALLVDLMSASPQERTMSKQQQLSMVETKLGQRVPKKTFMAAREVAMDRTGARDAWASPGTAVPRGLGPNAPHAKPILN